MSTTKVKAADPKTPESAVPAPVPGGPKGGAPKGRRLTGNLGPGRLYPGAGRLVQQTQQPVRCGTIAGEVFGYLEHPNSKDAKRVSTRFAGRFVATTAEGKLIQGYECYFPGTVERTLRAALDLQRNSGGAKPIPVALDVWCEPDEPGRPASPLGYQYVTYDRSAQPASDPLLELAYQDGVIERPKETPQLLTTASAGVEHYDPETGEVIKSGD
jgi:hypothetical protein